MENVPEYLKFTEEQIAQEARYQAELRAKYGIGRDHQRENAGQQLISYFERQVMISTPNLQRLVDEDADPAAITAEQNRLAVCYAYLGKFESALLLVTDDLVRARIERIKFAVERDDNEICPCPSTVHSDDRGTTVIDPRFSGGEYVYSPKHGKIMPVRVCSKCGDMQIGGTPAKRTDDSKHRDNRMAAMLARTKRRR